MRMPGTTGRNGAVLLVTAGIALLAAGCFSERSFPMHPGDVVRVTGGPGTSSTRNAASDWLVPTHRELGRLLPADRRPALLTADLVDESGRPVDVFAHFGIDPAKQGALFWNWFGLSHSAQAIGSGFAIDDPAPAWSGFEDVWIPVTPSLHLCGRLGFAKAAGKVCDADCIVVLPGLLGDNSILRTRDLAEGLHRLGFHVLALEVRGHGQTEARYPEVPYNFGALETGDLMAVSEWLTEKPHVGRTGLVGYCWGANQALLAAWYDGRAEQDPSIQKNLAPRVRPVSPRRHFTAGVIAFSPVLRFEEMLDELETPRAALIDPAPAALQNTVRGRMRRRGYPEVSGSLRKLIEHEFARSELSYGGSLRDGLRFLRWLPYRDEPADDKLACVRVPVLIVHGANDPVTSAQDVADLMATVSNPNVAAIILSGGGHIGFAPFAKRFYFSLIVNFFDPRTGPAAAEPPVAVARRSGVGVGSGAERREPRRAEANGAGAALTENGSPP